MAVTTRSGLTCLVFCLIASAGTAPGAAGRRCGCALVTAEYHDAWVRSEFNRALAVFSGAAVDADIVKATFKIEKVWKGKLASQVVLPTGAVAHPDGSFTIDACDWSYEKGKKYLIFAYGARPAEMKASRCTPTSRLEEAGPAVQVLNRMIGGQSEVLTNKRLQPPAPAGFFR